MKIAGQLRNCWSAIPDVLRTPLVLIAFAGAILAIYTWIPFLIRDEVKKQVQEQLNSSELSENLLPSMRFDAGGSILNAAGAEQYVDPSGIRSEHTLIN